MQTAHTKEMIEAAEANVIGKLESMLIRPSDDTEIDLIDDPLQRLGKKIQGLVEESKSMHMRLLNVERRLAAGKGDGEGRSRSLAKAVLNQSEADDFAHEAHLKLVTILSEVNDVKESFKLLKNTASIELLKPEGIPNFSNYVPYMTRLMELETHYSLLPQKDTVDKLVKDIDSLKVMIVTELGSSARGGTLPAGLVDVLNEIGSLKKQVNERSEGRKATVSIQPNRDPLAIVPETPTSDQDQIRDIPLLLPIDPNTEMLKQVLLNIQKTISQKVSRSELESIVSAVRRTTALSVDTSKMTETFNGFEDRMSVYTRELERLHKEVAEHFRTVSDVDDHVNRQDRLQQEALQRVRIEFSQRLDDFYEKINTAADDPESAKTINALKVVIMKMQKEIKEIKGEVGGRQGVVTVGKVISSGEESPVNRGEEGVGELVMKHESLLKQLSIQIAKIYADFEETQSQLQKQSESLLGGSLKQMEDLRKYVSTMMEKVNEGAKLSQSDLEKLNEVMATLEEKGDKTEIRTKVDKIELKKTHRTLSRRIEALQKELKRSESMQQMQPQREDPLMIKTRFEHECLACGQEVPFPNWQREWKASKRFPETRFRLGPGFSKILPVLKELSDVYVSHHQKTQSEGRTTPGEPRGFTPGEPRGYTAGEPRGLTPLASTTPVAAQSDRPSLHRIMTGNPSSRSTMLRTKHPSAL